MAKDVSGSASFELVACGDLSSLLRLPHGIFVNDTHIFCMTGWSDWNKRRAEDFCWPEYEPEQRYCLREIAFTQLSVPPVPLVNTCGTGDGVSVRDRVFSCLFLEVFSLVTVQSAAVAKQLLPKTLGPSNVNVAAHVQHVPHMVSNAPQMRDTVQVYSFF